MIQSLDDGVPMDGPTSILCDSFLVIISTTTPESSPHKKYNTVPYQYVHEANVTAGTISL
jgi:hypothetical protein